MTSECSGCQDTEGKDAYELIDQWHIYWNATLEVGAVQQQDTELQNLTGIISTTMTTLGINSNNLNSITEVNNNLTTWQPIYTSNVNNLDARVGFRTRFKFVTKYVQHKQLQTPLSGQSRIQ